MTTHESKLKLTDDDSFIEPEQSDDPRVAADEQFVHGLLQFLHLDSRGEQERRIHSVMNEIRRGELHVGPRVLIRASRRAVLAVAACIALVATIAYLGIAPEQSAQAMVQATINASKSAGPRRYEVRAELPRRGDRLSANDLVDNDGEPTLQRIALIDIEDSDHVLIRAITPRGHILVVGRNTDGEWAVRPDGSIERFDAQRAWPRWIELNGESILFESVDALVEQLEPNYQLERLDAEPDADRPARKFDRVVARKRAGPAHQPQLIALWIDPETRLVQRMELRWSVDDGRPDRDDSMRQRSLRNRRQAGDDAAGTNIEPGTLGAPPRGPALGLGPGTDGAQPQDDAAARQQRRSVFDRARDNQPGEPRNSRGQFDGNSPQRLDRPGRLDRPERAGDDGAPPPCFLDGPPRFRDGGHRPPPRIVIRLIETPEFEDGWFDPESHVRTPTP